MRWAAWVASVSSGSWGSLTAGRRCTAIRSSGVRPTVGRAAGGAGAERPGRVPALAPRRGVARSCSAPPLTAEPPGTPRTGAGAARPRRAGTATPPRPCRTPPPPPGRGAGSPPAGRPAGPGRPACMAALRIWPPVISARAATSSRCAGSTWWPAGRWSCQISQRSGSGPARPVAGRRPSAAGRPGRSGPGRWW